MAEITYENLITVGPPSWNETELAFARTTQTEYKDPFGREITDDMSALSMTIEPLTEKPSPGRASSDVGDISWFVPVSSLGVASYGYGLPVHSWMVVAATRTSIGTKALVTAAKTLTANAIDLYTDPDLLERVKADWRESRGKEPFQTLIPKGQNAPLSVK